MSLNLLCGERARVTHVSAQSRFAVEPANVETLTLESSSTIAIEQTDAHKHIANAGANKQHHV